MDKRERLIPRKIWLLWFQGVSEAPFIVRKCIDSWIRKNPTWDVTLLDSNNLKKHVDLKVSDSKLANLSMVHHQI